MFCFFSLSTQVSTNSHIASTTRVRFLVLPRLVLPDPVLVLFPITILVPGPIFATALVSVPAPVPDPILCSSTGFYSHSCSRSRFVPALVPVSIFCSLVSSPVFDPAPSPSPSQFTSTFPTRTPLPSPFPPPTPILAPFAPSRPSDLVTPSVNARIQTSGVANGAFECPQAPPPVYKYDDACRMKVPAEKKEKKIAAEDVLLPSLPPDTEIHWSVSPICALPV